MRARAPCRRFELERHVTVPVDPEPDQRRLDLVDGLGHLTTRVGVLDPQEDLPAVPACEEPVEEEGAHASDVEEACRARSHADADGHDRSIVGTRCNSARTSRLQAESTPRSTGSRRWAATVCRCSRRARACGARRLTRRRRSSASSAPRRGGHRRRRRARPVPLQSRRARRRDLREVRPGPARHGRRSLRDRGGRRHLPRRLASRRGFRRRPRAHVGALAQSSSAAPATRGC